MLDGDADLSGVTESARDEFFDTEIDICIFGNNAGRIAAEFKGNSFEWEELFEHPANFGGASETQHFNSFILCGFLGEDAGAVEDVDNSIWATGFVDYATKKEGAEGAVTWGFDNKGIAGSESRGNFVGGEVERPVVWDNCEDWADGDSGFCDLGALASLIRAYVNSL